MSGLTHRALWVYYLALGMSLVSETSSCFKHVKILLANDVSFDTMVYAHSGNMSLRSPLFTLLYLCEAPAKNCAFLQNKCLPFQMGSCGSSPTL